MKISYYFIVTVTVENIVSCIILTQDVDKHALSLTRT